MSDILLNWSLVDIFRREARVVGGVKSRNKIFASVYWKISSRALNYDIFMD